MIRQDSTVFLAPSLLYSIVVSINFLFCCYTLSVTPCVDYCRSGELHVMEDHNVSPWKRVGDHCSCGSLLYCVLLIRVEQFV